MIYLDHAATTPMHPEAAEAMEPFSFDVFGNSSGVHGVSRSAKNALEEARERLASLIGANPMEIVFTSGGTESDNLALKGAVLGSSRGTGAVTVATEHEAILETVDYLSRSGHPVSVVGVDESGRVDSSELLSAVDDNTAVVSVMLVNNESGVLQDLPAISEELKGRVPDVLLHTDAVQAVSFMGLDVESLGVDMLTVSGHKFGGPKGVGFLYVRDGIHLEPLLHGGGQELGRRSGTHDVAGAVGLATAYEVASRDHERFNREVTAHRDDLEKRLVAGLPDLVINTPTAGRSPHHLNIGIPGVRNETLLMRMDQGGISASAGSACQSGATTVSHVLEAMGRSETEARESVRFSLGWTTSADEVAEAADVIVDLVESLR